MGKPKRYLDGVLLEDADEGTPPEPESIELESTETNPPTEIVSYCQECRKETLRTLFKTVKVTGAGSVVLVYECVPCLRRLKHAVAVVAGSRLPQWMREMCPWMERLLTEPKVVLL